MEESKKGVSHDCTNIESRVTARPYTTATASGFGRERSDTMALYNPMDGPEFPGNHFSQRFPVSDVVFGHRGYAATDVVCSGDRWLHDRTGTGLPPDDSCVALVPWVVGVLEKPHAHDFGWNPDQNYPDGIDHYGPNPGTAPFLKKLS